MSNKTIKNILIAFVLNSFFSVFEFVGGFITGSTAIISDAVHDLGDAVSIGVSYFLERKSNKRADEVYTYGYSGYSVIGGLITTIVLITGSVLTIFHAVNKIINPVPVNHTGMIIFAVAGIIINGISAVVTHKGSSVNQRAVSLHMLEDVLGWAAVLAGAVIIKLTDLYIIDPFMSVGIALFIIISACNNLKDIFNLFLNKVPENISVKKIKDYIISLDGVRNVHHVHVWRDSSGNTFATMHIVTDTPEIRETVKRELTKHGINHSTVEIEIPDEKCSSEECNILKSEHHHCSHRHHH